MEPDRPIRALLVEDDEALRRVFRKVMRIDGRLDVVGEARDGEEAIRRAAELNPDIVLLDMLMPNMDGLEALPGIRAASPSSLVVMLSMVQDPAKVDKAIALGAAGFVDKTTEPRELIDQLLSLRAGATGAPGAGSGVSQTVVRFPRFES